MNKAIRSGSIFSLHWKKNWVILTKKVESLAELKFDPGFWVIREYVLESNWLDIDSQFKLALNIESTWTKIFSNYSESQVEFYFRLWLNFLGQNDSIFSFRVVHACSFSKHF